MITRRKKGSQTQTEEVRPSFTYASENEFNNFATDSCIAQIVEDSRNILEQIQRSQMLQCDVAGAIKACARELRSINRLLRERLPAKRRRKNSRRK